MLVDDLQVNADINGSQVLTQQIVDVVRELQIPHSELGVRSQELGVRSEYVTLCAGVS